MTVASPLLKCRDDVYFREGEDALLLFGGTPEVNRITGDDTALCRRIVELLHSPLTREDLRRTLEDSSDFSTEKLDELVDGLLRVGVLQISADRDDFTPEELEEHQLTLNYLTGTLRGEPGYRLLRAILDFRILLVGSEVLGSRVIAALLTAGFGRATIAVRGGAISSLEARNSPVFPRSSVGQPKAEFYAEYAASLGRPSVRFVADDPHTVESLLPEMDLVVCAHDIPDEGFLTSLNRASIAHKVPWVLARYFQDEGQVGPTFVPGVTACYECFQQRTISGVPYHREFLTMQRALLDQRELTSGLPAFFDMIAGYLAAEVLRLVQFVPREHEAILRRRGQARTYPDYASALGTRYSLPETWGNAVTIGLHPFELTKRRVLRLPRCKECGVHSHHEPQLVQWVLPL